MKSQIAIWKQLIVIAMIGGAGYALWDQREEVTRLTGITFGKEAEGDQAGGRRGKRGQGNNAVPVIVEAASLEKAVDRIEAIGNGLANRSVTIYPEVSGIISKIGFSAGQLVNADDILVQLDDAQAKIAVKLAETKLADTRRTLERYTALLKKNAVAEATADTARTAVTTAELELEQAQEALAERTVRAPFDGVVGIGQVERGDRVSDSTALVTLDDRSKIIVEFDVPEIYNNRLSLGQKVTATSAGLRGETFEGEITQINSRIAPATRSVRVRATLPNQNDQLRGGMSFQVTLVLEGKEYPSIAELALLWERDGAYVWSIGDDNKAKRVKVDLIKRAGGRILVDGDLKDGQLVVVEGTQRLRNGREVSFDAPAPSSEGTAGL